jgi:hypothetical protein
MFDELWSEIADAPGEIFDVIEYKEEWEKEEKFNVEITSTLTTITDVDSREVSRALGEDEPSPFCL